MTKRIMMLFLTLVLTISLVGCDIYADTSKKDMELIEIKVYDKDNNEIIGEYKNFRIGYHNSTKLNLNVNNNTSILPLNSAAPVENYYYVDAKENEPYTVKFIFHSSKGYKLTKISLNNNPELYYNDFIECDDIKKVDDNYVVTLTIEKIETSNQYYHTIAWYKEGIRNLFNTKGSNTYIKGVYFVLDIPTKTSC